MSIAHYVPKRFGPFSAGVFCFFIAAVGAPQNTIADSRAPDCDVCPNNNNSFEDAGGKLEVGVRRGDGSMPTVNYDGAVGLVPIGGSEHKQDSADFISINLRTNASLQFHLSEDPAFRAYLEIYDANGKLLEVSRGNATETIRLSSLQQGRYVAAVKTGIPRNFPVSYVLSITPKRGAIDTAGDDFKSARHLGRLTPEEFRGVKVKEALSSSRTSSDFVDAFQVAFTRTTKLRLFFRFLNKTRTPLEVSVYDANVWRPCDPLPLAVYPIEVSNPLRQSYEFNGKILDAGEYVIGVHHPGGRIGCPGSMPRSGADWWIDYSLNIAGVIRSRHAATEFNRAPALRGFELDPGYKNGEYPCTAIGNCTRYRIKDAWSDAEKSPLVDGETVEIKEWVDPEPEPRRIYKFQLNSSGRVEVNCFNFTEGLRVLIFDSIHNPVSAGEEKGISLNERFLNPQYLQQDLEPGTYYLVFRLDDPQAFGTHYHASISYSAK